jgi:hypothetical protein
VWKCSIMLNQESARTGPKLGTYFQVAVSGKCLHTSVGYCEFLFSGSQVKLLRDCIKDRDSMESKLECFCHEGRAYMYFLFTYTENSCVL